MFFKKKKMAVWACLWDCSVLGGLPCTGHVYRESVPYNASCLWNFVINKKSFETISRGEYS